MKHKLSEIIELNSNFKTSVNLYLDLHHTDKIKAYIPTKSSLQVLKDYLEAVVCNKDNSTILIGPYGKGKSHLLLVLLSIISLDKTADNEKVIEELLINCKKAGEIGNDVNKLVSVSRNRCKKYIPVILQNPNGDLQSAFIYALNEALKAEKLNNIIPETAFSAAILRIEEWKKSFPNAYDLFSAKIKEKDFTVVGIKKELKNYSAKALQAFIEVYPTVTSGSEFNPLLSSDVFSLYRSVSDVIVNEYGYGGLYIVFDEFSKFIEGQNEKNVGSNMRLIQDMCELANDSKNGEIFFTMVAHKSIKEYGKYLPVEVINSFTGIEGRIREKLFITSAKNNYELIMHAISKKESIVNDDEFVLHSSKANDYYNILPFYSSAFNSEDFKNVIIEGCYPLNPVTAYLLLNISEKIAQNERTLFTFIANDEAGSLARYVKEHEEGLNSLVNADLIYDYFSSLLKNEVMNERIHNIWLDAEYALSKCKSVEQKRVVKIIACFLIVNKEEELPTSEEIIDAANSFDNTRDVLDSLKNDKIVYVRESTRSYHFKTRAGFSLKKEIKRIRATKRNVNYSNVFERVMQNEFIIPRKYNSDYSMTRYYRNEYMSVHEFMLINNAKAFFDTEKFCDGLIVSLFKIDERDDINREEVYGHFMLLNEKKMIIIHPAKKLRFENQIIDYEILQEIKGNGFLSEKEENEVVAREIPILEDDLEATIKKRLDSVYLDDKTCTVFAWKNGKIREEKYFNLEKIVNECCEEIYCLTPIINNEIINRREINTAPTKKSRLTIIKAILNQSIGYDFYKGTNQEATIYRSLILNTGLLEDKPKEKESALRIIIDIIDKFIDSCSGVKKPMSELVDVLTEEPYGMRNAVIPIYLAFVLAQRKEDIVVYFSSVEKQLTEDIVINMCEVPQDYYLFISKESADKEKYIKGMNDLFEISSQRNLTENRIKNIVICMQRWFRALPQVSRNLAEVQVIGNEKEISKEVLTEFKNALQKLDVNPYELLFDSLPALLESRENYEECLEGLKKVKTYYDQYFSLVLKKAIEETKIIIGIKKKEDLFHAFKRWYNEQSEASKKTILDAHATNLMSCIQKLDKYDDEEVIKKIIKSVTDVYVDNWTTGSLDEYLDALKENKEIVEKTNQNTVTDEDSITIKKSDGKEYSMGYSKVSDSSADIMKNMLEEVMSDFDDLSVKDRVSVLVEMINDLIDRK